MKLHTLRLSLLCLLTLVIGQSCNNDIDVIGEWKEIPVVYGVFGPQNPGQTAIPEYFRIEKAFLDPSTDAFVIAQRPDSLYFGANEIATIWQYSFHMPRRNMCRNISRNKYLMSTISKFRIYTCKLNKSLP